jgi:hypothetical protein
VLVTFGGVMPGNSLNDTWEYADRRWTLRSTIGPPPLHVLPALAYDSVRRVTVLFGGGEPLATSDDTWTWDGVAWTRRATSGPSPRGEGTMAFDSIRGVCVLFGGSPTVPGSGLADTWEWDGAAWALRATSGPTARFWHGMTFDRTRARTVLFGGFGVNEAGVGLLPLADTWEWDGSAWSLRATNNPPARLRPGMAYDEHRQRTVLNGGVEYGSGHALLDTWEWDGAVWALRHTSGPSGREVILGFDPARNLIVRYGGEVVITPAHVIPGTARTGLLRVG